MLVAPPPRANRYLVIGRYPHRPRACRGSPGDFSTALCADEGRPAAPPGAPQRGAPARYRSFRARRAEPRAVGWLALDALGFGDRALAGHRAAVELLTGFYRGRLDQTVMRFVDALLSFHPPSSPCSSSSESALVCPGRLASAWRHHQSSLRIVRSAVLDARGPRLCYGGEARGEGALYIQYGEILPNVWAPIIVEGSINVGFGPHGRGRPELSRPGLPSRHTPIGVS